MIIELGIVGVPGVTISFSPRSINVVECLILLGGIDITVEEEHRSYSINEITKPPYLIIFFSHIPSSFQLYSSVDPFIISLLFFLLLKIQYGAYTFMPLYLRNYENEWIRKYLFSYNTSRNCRQYKHLFMLFKTLFKCVYCISPYHQSLLICEKSLPLKFW